MPPSSAIPFPKLSAEIYNQILSYRTFPEDRFIAAPPVKDALRQRFGYGPAFRNDGGSIRSHVFGSSTTFEGSASSGTVTRAFASRISTVSTRGSGTLGIDIPMSTGSRYGSPGCVCCSSTTSCFAAAS